MPEVRLAVAEPGLDIGNIEHCLESLVDRCYYLTAERNRYRFSFTENLNKRFADVRAIVTGPAIDDVVRAEIQKVFGRANGIETVAFPRKSGDIGDRPVLSMVIMAPEHPAIQPSTLGLIQSMTTESGSSSRTFKSALIWAVAEDAATLREEARRLLAWQEIESDVDEDRLDDAQRRQLAESVKKAERDLKECAWRTYKNVFILGEDNAIRRIDLGMTHSSQATSLTALVLSRLKQDDIASEGVAPTRLTKYWPPALPEWSTKAVRDAFYSSPKFPRLLKPDAVKDTISRGLDAGLFAYVGKTADGRYSPFTYRSSLAAADVEISDDIFLIKAEDADTYLAAAQVGVVPPQDPPGRPEVPDVPGLLDQPVVPGAAGVAGFSWSGDVPHQKWMNFYTKVLSRFANSGGLKVSVSIDVSPAGGVSTSTIDETKAALRELGARNDVQTRDR